MNTWIIVTERWAERPYYLTDISGNRSELREKAMKFTDRAMAWDVALEYQESRRPTDIRARVVPSSGEWGA